MDSLGRLVVLGVLRSFVSQDVVPLTYHVTRPSDGDPVSLGLVYEGPESLGGWTLMMVSFVRFGWGRRHYDVCVRLLSEMTVG